MKHLRFDSEREMQLQIAIANQELAPTIEFAGKHYQCFFEGRQSIARSKQVYEVRKLLSCMACTVVPSHEVFINSPESSVALDFDSFLHDHYGRLTRRVKAAPSHKAGRPKQSKKEGDA